MCFFCGENALLFSILFLFFLSLYAFYTLYAKTCGSDMRNKLSSVTGEQLTEEGSTRTAITVDRWDESTGYMSESGKLIDA